MNITNKAIDVYKPPFTYDLFGQMIFDSNHNLVADIRGWGRIQKMENPEGIQDEIGRQIAKAMTEHWIKAQIRNYTCDKCEVVFIETSISECPECGEPVELDD